MVIPFDERLKGILKATILGATHELPHSIGPGDVREAFMGTDALEPPYDPEVLCRLFEHSNSLRQNVDAYCTNIDGFGYRLEPCIDFEAEDADVHIAQAMSLEAMVTDDVLSDSRTSAWKAKAVAARRHELEELARAERARLSAFFDTCCFDYSFVGLRRRTRQDLEITGNAYWEVIRNAGGRVARLVHVPAHTVRLLPLDAKPVEVKEKHRVSSVKYEVLPVMRRLRRYVQRHGSDRVYFKSFGDPRVVSRTTGEIFTDIDSLRIHRPGDVAAGEIIHFAIYSPRSPYGVPRWIGCLLSVLGSREMEEINYLYFSNKSVPPLALLVSGGRLNDSSVPRIERFIEENLRGKNNFHKILILEADSAAGGDGNKTRIELKPLTDAQQKDGLFQVYDERNIDKVGASFRMPRLLRGESKDFNRSVADAQLRFCEDQVFQPERDEFDYFINHKLFPDMGICMWRFKSQSPITRDPERLTDSVERLVRVGVLTPEEGRALASDVFNREFRKIGDDWTKRPITLTLAGIQTGAGDVQTRPVTKRRRLLRDARELVRFRDELQAYEQTLAKRRMAQAAVALSAEDGDQ